MTMTDMSMVEVVQSNADAETKKQLSTQRTLDCTQHRNSNLVDVLFFVGS